MDMKCPLTTQVQQQWVVSCEATLTNRQTGPYAKFNTLKPLQAIQSLGFHCISHTHFDNSSDFVHSNFTIDRQYQTELDMMLWEESRADKADYSSIIQVPGYH